jgi:hypothetical protein
VVGTLVPAGAGAPGVGYDEHDGSDADDPSGPMTRRRTTATPTASTPADTTIEVARLDARTGPSLPAASSDVRSS